MNDQIIEIVASEAMDLGKRNNTGEKAVEFVAFVKTHKNEFEAEYESTRGYPRNPTEKTGEKALPHAG